MRKLASLLIICLILSVGGFSQSKIHKDFCISEDEFRLYELINAIRSENNIPLIKISRSLSFVAKEHVRDLNLNRPDTSICNLHSWSDQGDWTACCYQSYVHDPKCMWNKPDELTNYRANGYELAYWDETVIIPDSIIKVFENTPSAMEMILSQGRWEEKKWYALGVGIMNNYVAIWFGGRTDREPIPQICGKNNLRLKEGKKTKMKDLVIREKTDQYFLIYGSYDRLATAENRVQKYINEGYKNAKVVISGSKIRIALSHHASLNDAKKAKQALPAKYKDAWIIKY